MLGYKRFTELDFLIQVDVCKALKIFLKLEDDLLSLVTKIKKSEVLVKVLGEFEFNILGMKQRVDNYELDYDSCSEDGEILDDNLYAIFMTQSSWYEKGFTLKMSTEKLENDIFQTVNKDLLERYRIRHLISFVRCDNVKAIKFTEKTGFQKFIKFSNDNNTEFFGFIKQRR